MSRAAATDGNAIARQISLASQISRATRTMMIMDVVESTRLAEQDEEGFVRLWIELIAHIKENVLPVCDGRLVKDLGDGIQFAFKDPLSAVSASFAIQQAANRGNIGRPPDHHILLRFGIEVGEVFLNQDDVFGFTANVAQRLATLAGPSEIIVSARLRDQLTPSLDAEIEDLGECFVKHMTRPLRAYRIGPPGPRPLIRPWMPADELTPSIAVVPFTMIAGAREHAFVGEVLVEEVIDSLARSSELTVISRLSTTAFRGRDVTVEQIGAHLKVQYVLSGTYRIDDMRMRLNAELAEAKSGRIVWTQRFTEPVHAILDGEQQLIGQLISEISSSVMSHELQRARSQPLPTLKGYTLLMAAIALMHRLSVGDFEDARHLLQTLLDRSRRQPVPQAWLAKWHVLRVQQGWSPNQTHDTRLALQHTQEALNADPTCSLALAVDGFAHTNLLKRFDIAAERYDQALQANPNDSFAWLLKGTMHAFMGEGELAVRETEQALSLSPLDPHRYFYDSLAASACISAKQYERGLELAKRSLRANRTHTSTLRALVVAQARLGLLDDAHETVRMLLSLEPGLTVSRWQERSPATPFPTGKDWSAALLAAGVPE